MSRRVRYGVDGWPYLAGLSAAALFLAPLGAWARTRGRPVLGTLGLTAGLGAAVPASGAPGVRGR